MILLPILPRVSSGWNSYAKCRFPRLRHMAQLSLTMLRDSMQSFFKQDAEQARQVCALDDEVDQADADARHEFLELARRSPDYIDAALCLLACAAFFERIADHATNIAENVLYLVEGEVVRHQPSVFLPKGMAGL